MGAQLQCPSCGVPSLEGKKFCTACGTALAARCPACNAETALGARYCGDCGTPLSTAAQPRAETAAAAAPSAERRQLTVLFCDLVGSTSLSQQLDPEELRELLAQYQDACRVVVDRYGGFIARYVGDGLLVYFGYPQAHEGDAERAVRTGLGIVDAIGELNARLTYSDVALAVRIGINSGMVIVGDIGRGEQREEKAVVGESPNRAARLQGLAEPDSVVIGEDTRRLIEGLFAFDDLGEHTLKGISGAVHAYRVRGESDAPSRFEALAKAALTPLVGREEELGLLLKRWQQAKEGDSQVVLLSGEAGTGKSRLVRAFREQLGEEPHGRVLYYGSPYHQHSAFYPASDQMQRALRMEKDDTSDRKLDKLEAVLREFDLPVREYGALFASFLAIPTGERYSPLEPSPEDRKRRTLEAMVALIDAMSTRNALLMMVEDAQWIDPSTLELISLLIDRLRERRMLMVLTFRPEFEPPWKGIAQLSALMLNRLSQRECVAMVGKVAGGKALPPELLEQIVAKTDGVPLFVEELTKNLLESGLLEKHGEQLTLADALPPLAIPASLQDSLMARLDRLSRVKDMAQLAATLGRTFNHELLAAVTQLDEPALDDALTQLVAAGLIYRRGLPPSASYEFKHALVQDAAYQSLLKSTRQTYHQRIARVLEERFPEIVQGQPELLAHHYTEAALPERAIGYWEQAAEQATAHVGFVEAMAHLAKGLELARTLPDTPQRAARELGLRLRQAESLHFLGRRQEIVDLLEGQQAQIERLGDASLAGQHYFWLGWAHAWLGHRAEATRDLNRSLDECTRSGDEALVGRVHRALALEYTYSERRLDDAIAHARQAVALLERTADHLWLSQALYALSYSCYYAGDFEGAEAAAMRLDRFGQTMGSRRARAEAAMGGLAAATRGECASGIALCERALEAAPDPFETAFVLGCLGKSCAEAGDVARGVARLRQAVELADQYRSRQWRALFRAWLGEAHFLANQLDEAQQVLERTLEMSTEIHYALGVGWSRHLLGRIAQKKNDRGAATRHLDEAVRVFRLLGAKFELARAQLARAALVNGAGDAEQRSRDVHEAWDAFRALRVPAYVAHAERLARELGVAPAA